MIQRHPIYCNRTIALVCGLLFLLTPFFTLGQTSADENARKAGEEVDQADELERQVEEESDSPRWVALPVIWYTPETRLAFGASGLYYFDADPSREETSISNLQALFLYSLNNQLISEVNGIIFRSEDELQLRFTAAYYRYPNSFYGIGNNTLLENKESYTNAYPFLRVAMRQELAANIFLGLRAEFEYNRFINLEEGGLLENGINGVNGGLNWGPGFSVGFDNRDNQYFPYKGSFAEFAMTTHSDKLGSEYTYLDLTADVRQFVPLKKLHILAFQFYGQFQTGQAPFHRLALLGGPEQMRGYFEGRYRDRQFVAFQTEYRFPIWRWIRGSAFGTAGDVAPKLNAFQLADFKYSVGAGVRILLVPEERIYIRFDYGYALDGQNGFYFQFNEAF